MSCINIFDDYFGCFLNNENGGSNYIKNVLDPALNTIVTFLDVPGVLALGRTGSDLKRRIITQKYNFESVHRASRLLDAYIRPLLFQSFYHPMSSYRCEQLKKNEQTFDVSILLTIHHFRYFPPERLNVDVVLKNAATIQSLNISCSRITSSDLSCITAFPMLETLCLKQCKEITDEALSHLTTLSNLKVLNILRCNRITDAGLETLSHLTNLVSLHFDGPMSDVGLNALRGLRLLQRLTVSNITDMSLDSFMHFTKLKSVCFSRCGMSDHFLKGLHVLSRLEKLAFIACQMLTDVGVGALSQLTALQSLDFVSSRIEGASLHKLRSLSRLTILNLNTCDRLYYMGFTNILSLESLDLSRCEQINDECLSYLAKLSTLQTLNLSSCWKITDLGLSFLRDLKLQTLHIPYCNGITDAGLKKINTSNLKILGLYACLMVSEETKSRLRKHARVLDKSYMIGDTEIVP